MFLSPSKNYQMGWGLMLLSFWISAYFGVLKLSSYNFMVIVPSAVVVTKFEQLQCKLKQVA